MKLLFDTHIFLWAFDNHPQLSAEARYLLGEYDEELYFSPNVAKYGPFVRRV